eukprot:TRINITY_DN22356_c0_g1_i1.p1 TRINITY_DN22356_c0_g1~~TRINITY_DN22356_c0_g1_i1.p1  ORF type:complete len:987 (+),score=171.82 TRINITY_DN22356_c0_g1_i1:73-2961(+)
MAATSVLTQPPESLLRSYEWLTPVAQELFCVLVQPELDSYDLRKIGFACLTTSSQLRALSAAKDANPSAILVTSYGGDLEAMKQTCKTLDGNPNMPAVIAVLIVENQATDMEQLSSEVGFEYAKARESLFQAGADEVMCLINGEPLFPHRIMEVVQRIEFYSKKISDHIQQEIQEIQQRAAKKLQAAYRRFLMKLPGTALENLPALDSSLQERTSDKDADNPGRLVGVGEYRFCSVLGKGCCGTVYMAQNSRRKRVAIKVISKDSLTNAAMMFSLDRELCILMNLVPHPNITRAFEAMHGENYMHIVMEYGGARDLHRFTSEKLAEAKADVLPSNLVASFIAQESAAVAHLHAHMVCHRDLKPRNWIVNDAGDRIILTDFGLAAQLCGRGQPMKHGCGSLPFVAPEVLAARGRTGPDAPQEVVHGAYDGLQADVWSLAVNFIELRLGPYSIERRMNWSPKSKPTPHDLEQLEALWASMPVSDDEWLQLDTVIANMLKVIPENRWVMEQVVGKEGLDLGQDWLAPSPEERKSPKQSGQRQGCLESQERQVSRRPSAAVARPQCMLDRLGGRQALASAFSQMIDNVLSVPGLSESIDANPARLQAFRSGYVDLLPDFFLAQLELEARRGDREREHEANVRGSVRAMHSRCIVLDVHYRYMMETLEASWRAMGAPSEALVEVAARFRNLVRPIIRGDTIARASRARSRRTSAWKAQMLLDLGLQQSIVGDHELQTVNGADATSIAASFAQLLLQAVSRHAKLSHTRLNTLTANSIEAVLGSYFRCRPASGNELVTLQEPLLFDMMSFNDVPDFDHLAFVGLARDSLTRTVNCANHAFVEDADALHMAMVDEWEEAHFARAVAKLQSCNDVATLQDLAARLPVDGASRNCFERFGNALVATQGGMPMQTARVALAELQTVSPAVLERLAAALQVASPGFPEQARLVVDGAFTVIIAAVPLVERISP